MKRVLSTLMLGLALVFATAAGAATLVVPDPYKTVGEAIAAAKAGDTVLLRPGTYHEFVSFKDGITLSADPPGSATLEQPAGATSILVAGTCKSGAIRGITFLETGGLQLKTAPSQRAPAVKIVNSSLSITDCLIAGSGGDGLHLEGSNRTVVERCQCSWNVADGIFVISPAAEPVLRYNRCESNGQGGIHVASGAHATVENNVCLRNGHAGIIGEGTGSRIEARGNTCGGNGRDGLWFTAGVVGIAQGNTCRDNNSHSICVEKPGTRMEILGNVCQGGSQGLAVYGGAYVTSKTNTFRGQERSGISVTDAKTEAVLDHDDVSLCNNGLAVSRGARATANGLRVTDAPYYGCWVSGENTVVSITGGEIRRSWGPGVGALDKAHVSIQDSTVVESNQHGIDAQDMGTVVDVSRVGVIDNGQCGMRVMGGARARAEGCWFARNGGCGVSVEEAGSRAEIGSCTCGGNGDGGVNVEQGATAAVKGSACEKNGASGIRVQYPRTQAELLDNVCRDNRGHGIVVQWGASANVSGNTLSGNRKHDLAVLFAGTQVEKKDNHFGGAPEACTLVDTVTTAVDFITPGPVQALVTQENWPELERLGKLVRDKDLRDLNGYSQLKVFYESMRRKVSTRRPEEQTAAVERMLRWCKAYPDSITARIALAQTYVRVAWERRGSGFANSVSDEGWMGFKANLEAAQKALLDAEKLSQKDPHWYVLSLTVLMGLGASREEAEAVFERAVKAFPCYETIYAARTVALLPRWGGRPGEVEALASRAALLSREREGDGMYARVAIHVCEYVLPAEFLRIHRFEYARIRQGCVDLLQRHPEGMYVRNWAAFFAVLYNDQATAHAHLAKLAGPMLIQTWGSREYYAAARDWADGKGPRPELPAGRNQMTSIRIESKAPDEPSGGK